MPLQAERLAWLAETLPTLAGHRHRLLPHHRRHRPGRRVAQAQRHRGRRLHRRHRRTRTGRSSSRPCWPTRSRSSSPPRRSAWASTSPTSPSSSTTSRPARPSPTTSRSAGPAAASTESWGILLRGAEDADIQDYFIRSAFPPRRHRAEHGGRRCSRSAPSPSRHGRAARAVNLRPGQLDLLLKTLEVDGAIERDGTALAAHPAALDLRPRPGRAGHRAAPRRAGRR